ncbi:hypothetical protein J437_LFUL004432 [Ladona fulva]|uniref:HORMA domain-containing protein n=1 Tax=Ladona fulva TaxID=123851 RepID=A0A8K0K093_LADFU|nr:hypothetical protein J437_LFUL004432 [Ladona fulva]
MTSQQMMRRTQSASCSKSWQEMFPNPQLNEQTSCTFLKKLVAIAISNITYLRNIFPEGAFADRYLEGLNLKVLRDDGCFPAVSQLIKWIKGSFEALDYKYLRQLIIGIYNDPSKPNDVVETYSFHFSYTNKALTGCTYYQNDGKNKRELTTEKAVNPEETFRQTLSLFRHCILCTHSLKPLPLGAMINMRLLYYDDGNFSLPHLNLILVIVTPEDYEPPGFKPSPVSSYTFVNDPILLNLGKTDTPWHSMKLLVATDSSDFEVADERSTKPIDYKTPENSQNESGKSPVQMEVSPDLPPAANSAKSSPGISGSQRSQNAVVPTISPNEPGSALSTTGSRSSLIEENELQVQQPVRCPCGIHQDDGVMIFCEKCKYWQHAVCFKILSEDGAQKEHVCELCHDSNNDCTDPSLPHLLPNHRKEICLFRRVLQFCSNNYRLCVDDLVESLGLNAATAEKMITKLDEEGALKLTTKKSKGKHRLINKYALKKTIMARYFSENSSQKATSKRVNFRDSEESTSNMGLSESVEKMSISNDAEANNASKYTDGSRCAQKRNLSQETEVIAEDGAAEEEIIGFAKKRRKVSVPENFAI